MAYNEHTVQRIRTFFQAKEANFHEKKMFGGVCFIVEGKMCCGTHVDKKSREDFLMCRIGESAYMDALKDDAVIPMAFTGKPMKGYVYVTGAGFSNAKSLHDWLQRCLDFNPFAKSGNT